MAAELPQFSPVHDQAGPAVETTFFFVSQVPRAPVEAPITYQSAIADVPALIAAVDDYLHYLSVGDLRKSSRRVYGSRMRKFKQFLEERGDTVTPIGDDLPAACINAFVNEIEAQPGAASTRNNFASTLSNFAQTLGCDLKLKSYAQPNFERQTLTAEEQERYLSIARTWRIRRASVLAHLFLMTGIRMKECVQLKITDIISDADTMRLVIRGSGRRQARVIVLPQQLQVVMRSWLVERQRYLQGQTMYVFSGPHGGPVSPKIVDCIIRRIGMFAGMNVCVRTLRDTFAKANFDLDVSSTGIDDYSAS